MLLVVGIYITSISVLARDDSLFRTAGRCHHAIVFVSAITSVYRLNVDSQRVHEGQFTAARSLEALRHHKSSTARMVSSGSSKPESFML